MDEINLKQAQKQYEAQLKASAAYYDRLREKKKQEGTYRGRGRPRKVKVEVAEKVV